MPGLDDVVLSQPRVVQTLEDGEFSGRHLEAACTRLVVESAGRLMRSKEPVRVRLRGLKVEPNGRSNRTR